MKEIWLRTDERKDVVASLHMVSDSCDSVLSDLSAWKWIVLGTHSALQAAITLHLSLGNHLLVARPEDATAWLRAHRNGELYPESKMDDFLSLYKKLKKHEIVGYRFKPNGTQGCHIRRLNSLRNQFVHFMPQGWSIDVSCIPQMCVDCLDIVSQLGQRTRWENDEQYLEFGEIFRQCNSKLSTLHSAYAR